MQRAPELREWMHYEPIWLIVGSVLMVLLISWYGLVFWLTRKKKPRSLNTLAAKPYTPPDLTALKAKYLQLIAEVEASHGNASLTARAAHQQLSHLLRMFAYEARGHRVDTLTLADLKQTRYAELAAAIEEYYLPEFASVEHGSVKSAVATARKVVAEWN
ncbi:MAG: hypothetical protein Q4A34_00050 [Candidatus Saccharibacteria bacterium]|nr:hypothetical protein [Candidatus Saccharibacteria bacterium]